MSLPTHVYVQIARRCNLTCSMCGWKIWARNKGVMAPEIFDRVVSQCVAHGIGHIRFSCAQGEPLLNPHWEQYAEKAISSGITVNINTNCTPLGERNIQKMRQLAHGGMFTVQCSFAGYDKESYEKVYVGANFDDVSRKLQALWQAIGAIGAMTIRGVVYDLDERNKVFGYLASLGIPPDAVSLLQPDNFAGIVETVRPKRNEIQMCYVLTNYIGVHDDGEVTACASRDSEGIMRLGNIMESSIAELRDSQTYKDMIKAFNDRDLSCMKLCKDCDLR